MECEYFECKKGCSDCLGYGDGLCCDCRNCKYGSDEYDFCPADIEEHAQH